jgi:hypothetical protein
MKARAMVLSMLLTWLTGLILGIWVGGVIGQIAFGAFALIAIASMIGWAGE